MLRQWQQQGEWLRLLCSKEESTRSPPSTMRARRCCLCHARRRCRHRYCAMPAGLSSAHPALLLSSPHNARAQGDVADASASSRLAAISSEAADSADVLTEAAAAPRPAVSQEQQQQQLQQRRADELPSTSGRSSRAAAATTPSAAAAAAGSRLEAAAGSLLSAMRAAVPEPRAPQSVAGVRPLPELDYGSLRGGQYPFLYDPVYGLPIVRDVVRYGELLRDIRQGEVKQILWFHEPGLDDPLAPSSRCLVRYKDGRVKQSVAPPDDARIPYAMEAHGVTVRRARGAGAADDEGGAQRAGRVRRPGSWARAAGGGEDRAAVQG